MTKHVPEQTVSQAYCCGIIKVFLSVIIMLAVFAHITTSAIAGRLSTKAVKHVRSTTSG